MIYTGNLPKRSISRINRAALTEAANRDQFHELENCLSHGKVRTRQVLDMPSMMGYGSDYIFILTCGCSDAITPMGR